MQRNLNNQSNFKKNKIGTLTLSDFKNYCKTIEVKRDRFWKQKKTCVFYVAMKRERAQEQIHCPGTDHTRTKVTQWLKVFFSSM